MFLPAAFLWIEPVLVATAIVFIISLIGNMTQFRSRFRNALVTAIVFGIAFGTVAYLGRPE